MWGMEPLTPFETFVLLFIIYSFAAALSLPTSIILGIVYKRVRVSVFLFGIPMAVVSHLGGWGLSLAVVLVFGTGIAHLEAEAERLSHFVASGVICSYISFLLLKRLIARQAEEGSMPTAPPIGRIRELIYAPPCMVGLFVITYIYWGLVPTIALTNSLIIGGVYGRRGLGLGCGVLLAAVSSYSVVFFTGYRHPSMVDSIRFGLVFSIISWVLIHVFASLVKFSTGTQRPNSDN